MFFSPNLRFTQVYSTTEKSPCAHAGTFGEVCGYSVHCPCHALCVRSSCTIEALISILALRSASIVLRSLGVRTQLPGETRAMIVTREPRRNVSGRISARCHAAQ
jgi:hypothetical protein